jgi:L-iditol 2-dehydrogenase
MKQMKGLQVVQPRKFNQVEIPYPDLGQGGLNRILVRSEWAVVCGSDIPLFTGNMRQTTYPLAPGAPIHECVGQVIESSSDLFRPGDQVVAIPEGNKGLAEFFIANATKAIKLPDVPGDLGACCLIQPFSTVLNGVDRLGSVEGKSVTVVGLGSIGLFFCWLLKKRGAAQVTGIDPIAGRCRVAEEMGADLTFPQKSIEIVHAGRQRMNTTNLPDICIESVGHQMYTLNDCLELVRERGTVLAFGVPDQPVYTFEYETFFEKNVHLLAVVTPDWKEYLGKAADLYLQNREVLGKLITHRFPVRDSEKAYSLYESHEEGVLKGLLDFSVW